MAARKRAQVVATTPVQKLYMVKRVSPTVIHQDSGPPAEGQRIDFSVAGAGDQYILVPNTDFDPAKIDEQVGDWAARIAAVLTIEGPEVTIDEYGRAVPLGQPS